MHSEGLQLFIHAAAGHLTSHLGAPSGAEIQEGLHP
jgi:hypothetical protein